MKTVEELERLEKLLEGTKEDAPVSGKVFTKFCTNHFIHLHADVQEALKLTRETNRIQKMILAAVLAAVIISAAS